MSPPRRDVNTEARALEFVLHDAARRACEALVSELFIPNRPRASYVARHHEFTDSELYAAIERACRS